MPDMNPHTSPLAESALPPHRGSRQPWPGRRDLPGGLASTHAHVPFQQPLEGLEVREIACEALFHEFFGAPD